RSSVARWTPDHIREPEVKRDGKEVHGARARDACGCPLLEDLEPGKANVVADALSRKAEFAAITQAQLFFQDQIKEGLEHDPLAKKIIALAKDGRTQRFWLKGYILFTKGDRLYMPKWGELWTLALVGGTYYWPKMGEDVETFVRMCLICQQDKIEQKKSGGLLEPLPTPKGPWESVSVDLSHACRNQKGVEVLLSEIHWALLDGVVQDHGNGFKLLYEFSSPNGWANGEGECTIGALSSVLSTSYELSSSAAYKTMKEWHEQVDLARASLDKAAKKTKKWADERRRHVEFKVEEILSDRTIRRRGVPSYKEYLIKWRDLHDSEASWEAKDLLWQFANEIKRYHEDGTMRVESLGGGGCHVLPDFTRLPEILDCSTLDSKT
ncbi:putative nucleotidyltransferase, ribonuclease H, partial [Tanacetum coccineum]